MKERWCPIAGFENLYEVSDRGRIRSHQKIGRPAHGGILSQWADAKGYKRVRLSDGKRSLNIYVHRLVLQAFVGPRPSEIHETNHKNGRKADNRIENLEWVTPVENNAHSVANGFWHPFKGEQHGRHKLTTEQARYARDAKGRERQCDLARKFGVAPTTIKKIWDGVNWRCLDERN